MELVTIKTYDNSIETHLMKSKLEFEGVKCFVFDENIVSFNPLLSVAFGGIKIKINKKDLLKASNVIKAINEYKYLDEENELIKCSNCNSVDFYSGFISLKSVKGVVSIIISIIFTVYPIYYRTLYKCKSCGNEFE